MAQNGRLSGQRDGSKNNPSKITHRILLEDVPLGDGRTKPGIFSNQRQFTNFEGEWYEYPYLPEAEQMENAVTRLLDGCNKRFDLCTKHLKHGMKDFDDFYFLFQTWSTKLP